MRIIKKAQIKQILTPQRKQYLLSELNRQVERYEREIEQLRFQMQKQLKAVQDSRRIKTKERFEKEIHKRLEKIRAADFQKSQLEQIPLETEMPDGTVDTLCLVEEGDDWENIMQEDEIIIKNGKVHEIRKGRSEDDNELV
ncbi:YlqD family protein [Thalassorhabdus alkalitolerans]|uniref:YlqD family protein n=1 Tax=Thalassorhabdus alkalitolerans TaxID=2282697 RepID=A0ABW0YLA9_9BACI